ncbi:MAG: hypothetical protein KAS73_14875, partial [Candidatus Sabulitectum sp.]|nr:hypothetical protein [Candidatus Sabulitectum sp.]
IVKEQLIILTANIFLVAGCLALSYLWPFSTEVSLITRSVQLISYAAAGILPMIMVLLGLKSSTFSNILHLVTDKLKKTAPANKS